MMDIFFHHLKPVPNRVKFWSSLKRTFDMSFHLMFKVELTITARTVKSRFLFMFHLNVVKECFVFERLECAQMTHFQLTFVRMSLTIIWGHSRFFVRARHETHIGMHLVEIIIFFTIIYKQPSQRSKYSDFKWFFSFENQCNLFGVFSLKNFRLGDHLLLMILKKIDFQITRFSKNMPNFCRLIW